MFVNNDDLLPLGVSGPAASGQTAGEDNIFASQLADTFDSVDLLLAARAEAEAAEAAAKARGETPLPFGRGGRDSGSPGATASGFNSQSFGVGGSALDSDSPATMRSLGGGDMSSLSDARATETGNGIKNFLPGQIDTFDGPVIEDSRAYETGETRSLSDAHIEELLTMTVRAGASDLHLSVALPPMVRKDGRLVPLPYEAAQERDTQRIVYDILNNDQIQKFERTHELDFSYGVKGVGRFRFNVYRQRSSVGCAMRVIPNTVPSMESLKLPSVLRELTRKHSGLVLVTGPTGSGKSTTIASLIDIINSERECHILTIEDPIEYLHNHKKSMVNQRELGTDTDFVQQLPASRPARRPGRDLGRRDARPGNDFRGNYSSGNRAPGLCDAAHALGSRHDRPDRGCVPRASAGADPYPAFHQPGSCCGAAAFAQAGRRTRSRD